MTHKLILHSSAGFVRLLSFGGFREVEGGKGVGVICCSQTLPSVLPCVSLGPMNQDWEAQDGCGVLLEPAFKQDKGAFLLHCPAAAAAAVTAAGWSPQRKQQLVWDVLIKLLLLSCSGNSVFFLFLGTPQQTLKCFLTFSAILFMRNKSLLHYLQKQLSIGHVKLQKRSTQI